MSLMDTLSNISTGIGNITSKVYETYDSTMTKYENVMDRVRANKLIDDETVKDDPAVVQATSEKPLLSGTAKTIIFVSLGLIVVGSFVLRK